MHGARRAAELAAVLLLWRVRAHPVDPLLARLFALALRPVEGVAELLLRHRAQLLRRRQPHLRLRVRQTLEHPLHARLIAMPLPPAAPAPARRPEVLLGDLDERLARRRH